MIDHSLHWVFGAEVWLQSMRSVMLRKMNIHSAKNVQSNGWPFKSRVICRVQLAFNSGAKGLKFLFLSQHSVCWQNQRVGTPSSCFMLDKYLLCSYIISLPLLCVIPVLLYSGFSPPFNMLAPFILVFWNLVVNIYNLSFLYKVGHWSLSLSKLA
jgi:hypothetical protein